MAGKHKTNKENAETVIKPLILFIVFSLLYYVCNDLAIAPTE